MRRGVEGGYRHSCSVLARNKMRRTCLIVASCRQAWLNSTVTPLISIIYPDFCIFVFFPLLFPLLSLVHLPSSILHSFPSFLHPPSLPPSSSHQISTIQPQIDLSHRQKGGSTRFGTSKHNTNRKKIKYKKREKKRCR